MTVRVPDVRAADAVARDVAEARRTITDLALAMASRGEIEIRGDGQQEMVA